MLYSVFSVELGRQNCILLIIPIRDLHGPDFVGPARRPHGPARGPELSLGPGPFRPVAWPSPARPGSVRPDKSSFHGIS